MDKLHENLIKSFKNSEKIKFIYKYEKVKLKIYSTKRKFTLPYHLKIYIVLPDQSIEYVKDLRKNGKKVSYIKGEYQILVKRHNVSYKSKLKLLDKLFQKDHNSKISIYDNLVFKFNSSANAQKSTDFMSTEHTLILDSIATFLISNDDNSDFLTETKQRKIRRYELYSYFEDIPYEIIQNIVINNKEKYTKHITHRPRLQVKRWKRSKTYKLNCLINSLKAGYVAKWCYIDENNIFEFEGNKYKIEDENYYIKKYGMFIFNDILVIKDNGRLRFFNPNIDEINNKNILVSLEDRKELIQC